MAAVRDQTDRFGNRHAAGLPYARGRIVSGTEDDYAKLRRARRIVERRHRTSTLFNFTGLERSLVLGDADPSLLDDELGAAVYGERLTELALEHLGGEPDRDDVVITNRLTAAIFVALQVLVRPGSEVLGVSASYSHPSVLRAVRFAGGELIDAVGFEELAELLNRADDPSVVVLTRLAVTYEPLPNDELSRIVDAAHERGVTVFVDDAGGARVGPAVLGQPKTLELGAEVGATGLDKYGTLGPRLGLLVGRRDLAQQMRARALELGMDARPLLYPAVVHSLEQYRPERVRELVATTKRVGAALRELLGDWVVETPVAFRLQGEDILGEAMRRGGVEEPPIVPVEATAALAMVLLRDHGIFTVHFAALPPGTDALLIKFVPPETLARFGGEVVFAAAVDSSLDTLAQLLERPAELRELLMGARDS